MDRSHWIPTINWQKPQSMKHFLIVSGFTSFYVPLIQLIASTVVTDLANSALKWISLYNISFDPLEWSKSFYYSLVVEDKMSYLPVKIIILQTTTFLGSDKAHYPQTFFYLGGTFFIQSTKPRSKNFTRHPSFPVSMPRHTEKRNLGILKAPWTDRCVCLLYTSRCV